MTNRQTASSQKNFWFGLVSVPTLKSAHQIFFRREFAVLSLDNIAYTHYIKFPLSQSPIIRKQP
jgi:hypothetical protein